MKKNPLSAFLNADYPAWKGLTALTDKQLKKILGEPTLTENVHLGYYAAQKWSFPLSVASGGLYAYIREGEVIMIEAMATSHYDLISRLPPPCGEKVQEILLTGAYVSEQLYCQNGLILSVAAFFDTTRSPQIVRIRSIQPFDNPNAFDTRFYKAFEDQMSWQ